MPFVSRAFRAIKEYFRPIQQNPFHKLPLDRVSPTRVFKRLQFKRLGANYYGRNRKCYVLGIRRQLKAMAYSTQHQAMKSETMDRLYETRISAACLEHGIDKFYFLTSLAECDINLNRETLSNLAIYEPYSFQSLVQFVKERSEETGLQSTKLGSKYGTLARGIDQAVKNAKNS